MKEVTDRLHPILTARHNPILGYTFVGRYNWQNLSRHWTLNEIRKYLNLLRTLHTAQSVGVVWYPYDLFFVDLVQTFSFSRLEPVSCRMYSLLHLPLYCIKPLLLCPLFCLSKSPQYIPLFFPLPPSLRCVLIQTKVQKSLYHFLVSLSVMSGSITTHDLFLFSLSVYLMYIWTPRLGAPWNKAC